MEAAMMKEKYVKAKLEVLELNDDIILASGPDTCPSNCSDWTPVCPGDNGSHCSGDVCPDCGSH